MNTSRLLPAWSLLATSLALVSTGCSGSSSPHDGPVAVSSGTADADDEADEGIPATMKAAAAEPGKSGAAPASGEIGALESLFDKTASGFPKSTTSDAACVGAVGLVGDHAKDYDALGAECGTGTGMKEFTRKVSGKLDGASHPSDTYSFKMLGGLCYRFFVVGDPSLDVIDVRVHRPNGALLSMVETKQGVAILDPKEPWCKKHDREFQVVIQAGPKATGAYTFGIWARPGK